MVVIGIDFGNDYCVVSVLQKNRVEIAVNDYFERKTKSCVAFTQRSREIGVAAFDQLTKNVNNTFYGFKSHLTESVQAIIDNKKENFDMIQILAMLLSRLKSFSKANPDETVDCVIAFPTYFNSFERSAILVAAGIAGLSCVSLIKESTAVAINYVFYKKITKPSTVVFVDFGHSSLQICICKLTSEKIEVLAEVFTMIGGRDIDEKIAEVFMKRLNRNEASVENKPFYFGLLNEVEKLKKKLGSGTGSFPLRLDSLLRDDSVALSLNRPEMEEMCANIFNKVEQAMVESVNKSALGLNDIDSIELVGGSSRIPKVKNLIKQVFGKAASTTMNQDEAVAKGCILKFLLSKTKRKLEIDECQDFLEIENSFVNQEGQIRIKDMHPNFDGCKDVFLPVTEHSRKHFINVETKLEDRDAIELKRCYERNSLDRYCNGIQKSEFYASLDQQSKDELSSNLNTIKHWNDGTADDYLQKRCAVEKWIEAKKDEERAKLLVANDESNSVEIRNNDPPPVSQFPQKVEPTLFKQKIQIRTIQFTPEYYKKRRIETVEEIKYKKHLNSDEKRILELHELVKILLKTYIQNIQTLDENNHFNLNVKLETMRHFCTEEKGILEEQLHRCRKLLTQSRKQRKKIMDELRNLKRLLFVLAERDQSFKEDR